MRYFVRQRRALEAYNEHETSRANAPVPVRTRRVRSLSPEARCFLALCVALGYVDGDGVCLLTEVDFGRLRECCRVRLGDEALVQALVARLRPYRPTAAELSTLLDGAGPLSPRALFGLPMRLRELRAEAWLGEHVRELIATRPADPEAWVQRQGCSTPAEAKRMRVVAKLRRLGLPVPPGVERG